MLSVKKFPERVVIGKARGDCFRFLYAKVGDGVYEGRAVGSEAGIAGQVRGATGSHDSCFDLLSSRLRLYQEAS
ncbi:unnamed protein product [Ilex paraguariensis]|uniref:Uncharacterized protein n=1 Tax=Ilex paraguariensis TaxID=185542 RepID=A0ABC8UH01_9AQUA